VSRVELAKSFFSVAALALSTGDCVKGYSTLTIMIQHADCGHVHQSHRRAHADGLGEEGLPVLSTQ
jgi:hypothetical protein